MNVKFMESEAKLFEALHMAVESGGGTTCLLDEVGNGTSYILEEVGRIFNITRERIRQIEVKALRKLREKREDWPDLVDWEENRSDARGGHDF